MKRSVWIYTVLGVGLAVWLATGFQSRLSVHPYVTWIAGFSFIAWAFYAWDKRTAELKKLLRGWRVPEFTLNLLTILGGFPGAWVGRAMFNHKTNTKRHPAILAILIASTVLHALFALRLIYGPPITLWPPSNWLTF